MKRGVSNQTLGEYLRTRRLSRGLDFKTCAERSGLHHTFWRNLEAGQYASPDPKHLKVIAETLECPLEDLYSLCRYPIATDLPSLVPYLRATTDLGPEDIALMNRMFESLDREQARAQRWEGGVNTMAPARVLYLRGELLSPQDRRGLESYYALLRGHFGISVDSPVFPTIQPRLPGTSRTNRSRPSRSARNGASHPWRATVGRGRS